MSALAYPEGSAQEVDVRAALPRAKRRVHDHRVRTQPRLRTQRRHVAPQQVDLPTPRCLGFCRVKCKP